MTADLVDAISGLVTPDLVETAAAASGEAAETTRSALLGAVPALFACFADAASTPAGAARLFDEAARWTNDPGICATKEAGGRALLSSLLGPRTEAFVDALANSAGVRRTSAGGILALLAPVVLVMLGREAFRRKLDTAGFRTLLLSQKDAVLQSHHLPKGICEALRLEHIADLGGPPPAAAEPVTPAAGSSRAPLGGSQTRPSRPEAPRAARTTLRPIALFPAVLLAALALWGLTNMLRGRPRGPEFNENPTLRQGPQPPEGPPLSAHPEARLPELKFSFDHGATRLAPRAEGSMDALVSFLVVNPTARVHIEGLAGGGAGETDRSGAASLPLKRAETIKDRLVAAGIRKDRIETSGAERVSTVGGDRQAEVTLIR